MIRVTGPGHLIFAFGTAGIAILGLAYDDFALQWQPLPSWIADPHQLAYAAGLIVLGASFGVFVEGAAIPSALLLTVYQSVWVLTRGAALVASPLRVDRWLGFSEALGLMIGGWILLASLVRQIRGSDLPLIASERGMRAARLLFGLCCAVYGLSHFANADFTADMIPRWLPNRLGLAYLTGAGHIAAGLALVFAVVPRLAAILEALMLSSFVLLVHVPSIGAAPALDWAPTSRLQWTAFFIASTLAGAAWLVVGSLHDSPRSGARATRPKLPA